MNTSWITPKQVALFLACWVVIFALEGAYVELGVSGWVRLLQVAVAWWYVWKLRGVAWR